MIAPAHIDPLVRPFHERSDTQVTTLCIRATDDEAMSRTVNKVVRALDGRALYFSKWAVPFDRDHRGVVRWKHVGLYAYRRAALEAFHGWPPSPLELAEGLEQLRFLEHGIPIVVAETDAPTIGVDTEEDLKAVEARLTASA
jgi:3-deoxy-manno-octulosonate cytidylyltransferase (CMP-KDO synthetase)